MGAYGVRIFSRIFPRPVARFAHLTLNFPVRKIKLLLRKFPSFPTLSSGNLVPYCAVNCRNPSSRHQLRHGDVQRCRLLFITPFSSSPTPFSLPPKSTKKEIGVNDSIFLYIDEKEPSNSPEKKNKKKSIATYILYIYIDTIMPS